MKVTAPETQVKMLPCDLTDTELLECGQKLSSKTSEKEDLELKKAQITKRYGIQIKACQVEIDDLAGTIKRKSVDREVMCQVVYNSPRENWKEIIRLDTLAVVNELPMEEDEIEDIFKNPPRGDHGDNFVLFTGDKLKQQDFTDLNAVRHYIAGLPDAASVKIVGVYREEQLMMENEFPAEIDADKYESLEIGRIKTGGDDFAQYALIGAIKTTKATEPVKEVKKRGPKTKTTESTTEPVTEPVACCSLSAGHEGPCRFK